MRSIIFYPGVVLSLIFINIFKFKVQQLTKKEDFKARTSYIHKKSYNWANWVMKLANAKVTVKGKENIPKNKTILFVANHQSNFDIPILISSLDLPIGFIAKKELEKWPILSTWMRYNNCIFMDRSNLRKSAQSIVEGANLLKNGHSLVIFPEGTRSKGGPIQEFKAGSFKLATKSKCTIVPITINGSHKLLEANKNRVKGGNVELIIHPAIDVATLEKSELETLNEKVYSIVNSDYKKI